MSDVAWKTQLRLNSVPGAMSFAGKRRNRQVQIPQSTPLSTTSGARSSPSSHPDPVASHTSTSATYLETQLLHLQQAVDEQSREVEDLKLLNREQSMQIYQVSHQARLGREKSNVESHSQTTTSAARSMQQTAHMPKKTEDLGERQESKISGFVWPPVQYTAGQAEHVPNVTVQHMADSGTFQERVDDLQTKYGVQTPGASARAREIERATLADSIQAREIEFERLVSTVKGSQVICLSTHSM